MKLLNIISPLGKRSTVVQWPDRKQCSDLSKPGRKQKWVATVDFLPPDEFIPVSASGFKIFETSILREHIFASINVLKFIAVLQILQLNVKKD